MARQLTVWLVTVVIISACLISMNPVVQAASPQYLDLGDPIEAGLGGWQEYWDLTKHVAVVHTSTEALRAYNSDLAFNLSEVDGGLKDYGEQAKPAGKQMIEVTPLLNIFQERMTVKAGHLYVVKTKSLGYFALYMDNIKTINGDTCMAFTLYQLSGAPSTTPPTKPLQPRIVLPATTHELSLGDSLEGGLGESLEYWDLAKQVAVAHTSSEALRQYNHDLAYNQSEVGGGLKDYGKQSKPTGNQVIQVTPVLNMFQERMKVQVGHLYVIRTTSAYLALYMDDIQEVSGDTCMAFTIYKLAKAPVPTPTTQPAQPTQPTQPNQPTQPTNAAPMLLTVVSNMNSVNLSWTAPAGKTPIGYYLYRGTTAGKYDSMPLSDFPTKATDYTDAKVEIGKTYYYVVRAVWSDYTQSSASNEVVVQVAAPATVLTETKITTEIWLQVDNPRAKVNGHWQEMQAPPRLAGERVIVPFRFIGQSIGAEIGYVGEEQKVTYRLGDLFLELWLNQTRVRVNGKEGILDVAPTLVDGSYTFVPLRFVATQLGAQLNWNPDDSSVTIISVRTEKTATPPAMPTVPTAPTTHPGPSTPGQPASKQVAYWIEGGVRLVIDGEVAYEDAKGIHNPAINPEGTLIAYSHGDNQIILGNFEGESAVAYEHFDVDYRVYPMTWSSDGTEILFITSYSGGFTGGNQVGILNLDTEKVTWIYKGATAADWASDGRIVVSTTRDILIVDRLGRTQVDLTPAKGGLFIYADDPTFSASGTVLIYQLGEDFYLHNIVTDVYLKVISTAYEGDPARIDRDGRIIYVDNKVVMVLDLESGETETISQSTDCSYPGWMN